MCLSYIKEEIIGTSDNLGGTNAIVICLYISLGLYNIHIDLIRITSYTVVRLYCFKLN